MKKSFTLLTMLVFIWNSNQALAQESAPGSLSLSGSVDVYYRVNLNARNAGDEYQVPATSFANLPGFSLGMINFTASYQADKGGFVTDLVFGPRGEDAVFASPYYNEGRGSSQIINQLYVYWNASDKLTLSMGNFNTFLGYEVISPAANFNYSTSYMFSYGPFSHTGIRADLKFSDQFSVMASLMNPTDLTEFNPLGTYTAGLQFALFGSTYINFLYGDQDGKLDRNTHDIDDVSAGNTLQIDLTTGLDLHEKIFLGFNATYNTTSSGEVLTSDAVEALEAEGAGFYGAATYLQFRLGESYSVGSRLEYFKVYNSGLDIVNLDSSGDGEVLGLTLSGNARVGNLTLIPELRLDITSQESFLNKDMEPSKTLSSILIAAVYAF